MSNLEWIDKIGWFLKLNSSKIRQQNTWIQIFTFFKVNMMRNQTGYKKVSNMLMGVTNLIHTCLWETPNKTEMTTSVQRAGRIGPYPKVNNQYDWLSNTIQKSDWITGPNGFIFSNGIICIIITQPSSILRVF